MPHLTSSHLVLPALGILVLGCTPKATAEMRGTATPLSSPAEPTAAVASETPDPAVQTFHDPQFGFTFDYPADWMLDAVSLGDRAPAAYQLTSWTHEPGMVSGVPPGGTIMSIGIQYWDPKGDLDAYTELRKSAWLAAGLRISAEEEIVLANGNRALVGIVTESDEGQGYFLFTLLGEDYLFATGDGDVELLAAVARSIR